MFFLFSFYIISATLFVKSPFLRVSPTTHVLFFASPLLCNSLSPHAPFSTSPSQRICLSAHHHPGMASTWRCKFMMYFADNIVESQIVVEDRDNIAAISITLERVANVSALSTAYVALLSQSDTMDATIGEQLKACLVKLHRTILSFLASAIRYLGNHKKEAGRPLIHKSSWEV